MLHFVLLAMIQLFSFAACFACSDEAADESRKVSSAEWHRTRERVLKRAGHRCERCCKPDRAIVLTYTERGPSPRMCWKLAGSFWDALGGMEQWYDQTGAKLPPEQWPDKSLARKIWVMLKVVPLGPSEGGDENLIALCDWCRRHLAQLRDPHSQKDTPHCPPAERGMSV